MDGHVSLVPVQPVEVPAHCTAKTWARCTAKIVPTPGCHYWVGALAADGYRRFTANGGTVGAWRFRWTAHHGPLPPQVVVMVRHQSCDQPSCTRPGHLRAGSQAENLASAASRDRTEAVAAHRPRGPACRWPVRSRAIRSALTAGCHPQRLQAALDAGDPRAHWAVLF